MQRGRTGRGGGILASRACAFSLCTWSDTTLYNEYTVHRQVDCSGLSVLVSGTCVSVSRLPAYTDTQQPDNGSMNITSSYLLTYTHTNLDANHCLLIYQANAAYDYSRFNQMKKIVEKKLAEQRMNYISRSDVGWQAAARKCGYL